MASLSSLFDSCAFFLLFNFLMGPSLQVDGIKLASHHVVSVRSLLPRDVCNKPKGPHILNCTLLKSSDPSRLEVVNRHGPCSPLKPKQKPTQEQIFSNDQLRVEWLQSKKGKSPNSMSETKIPARPGIYLGAGNYVVTVGLGTPKVAQTVIFDTGSDVAWIQCQPCVSSCYPQAEPLFNPTRSSTYANISCSSPDCAALDRSGCLGGTCIYDVKYADNSETTGFFATDTLTLPPSDTLPNFKFGCGEENSGLFGQVAGLFGLGRGDVSIVSQSYQKYGGVFSYCLPSDGSSTGYLTFGRSTVPSNVQFTPMLSYSVMPSFYFLELISISVGGQKLGISPALFSDAGTVIDSGTVITRLPPTAYVVLRDAFRKGMSQYPSAPGLAILDTCYDFSKYQTVTVPSVSMGFRGAAVDLDFLGVIYVVNSTQACLGFAPNGDDTDLVTLGNTQQRSFNVVYDLSKGVIGFGPKGC